MPYGFSPFILLCTFVIVASLLWVTLPWPTPCPGLPHIPSCREGNFRLDSTPAPWTQRGPGSSLRPPRGSWGSPMGLWLHRSLWTDLHQGPADFVLVLPLAFPVPCPLVPCYASGFLALDFCHVTYATGLLDCIFQPLQCPLPWLTAFAIFPTGLLALSPLFWWRLSYMLCLADAN